LIRLGYFKFVATLEDFRGRTLKKLRVFKVAAGNRVAFEFRVGRCFGTLHSPPGEIPHGS